MEPECSEWLSRVAEAAGRAADDLRHLDDTYHRALVEDLERLRARLAGDVEADRASPPARCDDA